MIMLTDGQFLKRIQTEKRFSEKEMADLLGLNSPQSYQYFLKRNNFTDRMKEQFRVALKLESFNPKRGDVLLDVLYKRLIKIEAHLYQKTASEVKKDIEMDIQLSQ